VSVLSVRVYRRPVSQVIALFAVSEGAHFLRQILTLAGAFNDSIVTNIVTMLGKNSLTIDVDNLQVGKTDYKYFVRLLHM
jgi:hypothetical protein